MARQGGRQGRVRILEGECGGPLQSSHFDGNKKPIESQAWGAWRMEQDDGVSLIVWE